MTENTKIPAAQNSNDNRVRGIGPNAENTKNPKESSDWLGGPQNGDETPGGNGGNGGNGDATSVGADYTKHRFNETPSEAARNPQTGERQKQPTDAALSSSDAGRMGTGNIAGTDWLGGPQNGDEIPGNGGNGGNGGNSSGSGDGDATKVGSAYWQF